MANYEAYGIDTSNSTLYKKKSNAPLLLWEKAMNIEWFKDMYDEYCDDNEIVSDEEAREAFVEDYESHDGAFGFEALLRDVINELADPKERSFVYGDYILGVPATLPDDEKDRATIWTKQQIREILAEYVNPLLEESVVVQWYTVDEEW